MRSACTVYVDAGYLLASAATRVTGTSLRNGIHVEYGKLIEGVMRQAEDESSLPVLRVLWYDAAKEGVPDLQQERIGELPRVKLRLGRFGVDGQQKGVDLRIGLDLVTHARNGAADAFFLISGDDDLTLAVDEAQAHGVQVTVLAVPNAEGRPHGVSRHLVRAADDLSTLRAETIDSAVTRVEVPPVVAAGVPVQAPAEDRRTPSPKDVAVMAARSRPSPAVTPPPAYSGATGESAQILPGFDAPENYDDQIDGVVTKVLDSFRQSATPEDLAELALGRPSIPREIDRALLQDLSDALDVYDLSDPIRFRLRDRFWVAVDAGKTISELGR